MCFGVFRNLVRGLDGGIVKREVGDGNGNTANEISSLRKSMEIMMENVNHMVTKQQVGRNFAIFGFTLV